MAEPAPTCSLCSGPTSVMGPVYHPRPLNVASVPIDLPEGTEFVLRRCASCGFVFKHPGIPQDKLLDCYRRAAWTRWEGRPDPRRRRFDDWRSLAESHTPGRRILEIGCSNGAMLEFFGDGWERFAVEPGADAARVAAERGVKILGRTIDDVDPGERFHAVISVDVVEHVPDPLPFFRAAAARLHPGGILIIVTGDTDSLPWRLAGSRNWYPAYLEHVSFYNDRCMREIGRRCGLETVAHTRTSHARTTPRERASHLVKNVGYAGVHALGGFGVPALRRVFVTRRAPGWESARDHMAHIFRRAN
jgi:SAM-dependent methyltransferase